MRFVLVAGTTRTALIDDISAAGANPEVMGWTPSADAELLVYGEPVRSPVVPVSPTGCPTPAVVARAVRERLGFEATVVDAGLVEPTAAPTVSVGATPGGDIRDPDPVPDARNVFARAKEFGRALPDEELVVGETIPGGTTTALGVLTALGEDATVSSSLPENPLDRKRELVADALAASNLSPGGAVGDPVAALRNAGDPVLAVVAGLVVGAVETGTEITLAGGSQMVAAAALVRHAGVDTPLSLATTSFVAADETATVRSACERLNVEVTVTDPGFESADHVAMERYVAGEAKEGVGMGGALALASEAGRPMADVRAAIVEVADRLGEDDAT